MVLHNARADVWVVDTQEAGVNNRLLVASVWVAGDPPPVVPLTEEVDGQRPTILTLSGLEARAFA